jgi:hypothetical protein
MIFGFVMVLSFLWLLYCLYLVEEDIQIQPSHYTLVVCGWILWAAQATYKYSFGG